MQIVSVEWAETKDDFITTINDGEWHVMKSLNFVNDSSIDCNPDEYDRDDVIGTIFIGNPNFTTSRIRQFCSLYHPEIDFDKEFITNEPGVFDRYHDRFGYDYSDWVQEKIYSEMEDALNKIGFRFPWA